MIIIRQVTTLDHQTIDLTIASSQHIEINAEGLTLFPGLIDPHVHFRTPGLTAKEDWRTGARAAIAGGYTTVFDMPNTLPPTITAERLKEKKILIDQQLQETGVPLRYQLFFGADKHHLAELSHVKEDCIGIKVFMGCSTGNLVIDDDESLHAVFDIAAKNDLIVAVHAEDEHLMQQRKALFTGAQDYAVHSQVRSIEVAARAVEKAIQLVRVYGTRLYLLHVSTAAELALVRQAKAEGLPVYAETTPHHLFLDESHYATLKGKAVVNPPLRLAENHAALFEAIHQGTLDTIGSDHAPHAVAEKEKPYGECPSGMPGIETTLSLLLNAYHQGLLSLQEILSLTVTRPRTIFHLPENQDYVLVDLNKERAVTENTLKTKCGWSPFAGKVLKGWPVYTIVKGIGFDLKNL